MSIKIMAEVWESGPSQQGDRFVLLALADHANDQGECWPSIGGLARKTCMSDRGVQKVLRRLEGEGWIEIEAGGGRKNCNLYRIKTPNTVHPEHSSPPNLSAKRVNLSAENPEHSSPEPSRTIKEPSAAAAREREKEKPDDQPTDRDRYLAALGLDYTGMTGHGSARLGTAADMEVARKWTAAPPDGLGLSVEDCVQVIREVVERGATPRRFAYFDPAMSELAAARRRPLPKHKPRAVAGKPDPSPADRLSRWERLANG